MNKIVCYIMALCIAAIGSVSYPAFAADKGLSGKDKSFIKDAASGGMMEVQLGQIAKEKATSPEVKSFGEQMVTDHGKANEELKALAEQKKISVSAKLERKHQSKVDKLSKLTGTEFDKAYVKEMVEDHTKDVADFQKATKNVKDPDLNAWAGKKVPVLQQHLQMAKDLAQKLGVK